MHFLYNHFRIKILWLSFLLPAGLCEANQVAFFYALDPDLKALQQELGGHSSNIEVHGRTLVVLKSGNLTVVATKMKPGPVETAISAEVLLGTYPCSLAVSVGPAGSLSPDLESLTWGIVNQFVPYQTVTQDGQIIQMPKAVKIDQVNPAGEGLPAVNLVAKMQGLPRWTAASGESFIASSLSRENLLNATKAEVVEMNLFGLVAACRNHSIPGMHLRIVSDQANENARNTFLEFVQNYKGEGGAMMAAWLKTLPPDPGSPLTYPRLRSLIEEK